MVNAEPQLLATVMCPLRDSVKDDFCRRTIGHFVRCEHELWFVHPTEGHRATRVHGRDLQPRAADDWILVDHDVFECKRHNRLSKINGRLVTREMLMLSRELVLRATIGDADELMPARYVPMIRDDVRSLI